MNDVFAISSLQGCLQHNCLRIATEIAVSDAWLAGDGSQSQAALGFR